MGEALVKYWLHEPCSEDWDEFILQIAQANFLEKRMFETLGKLIHGTK